MVAQYSIITFYIITPIHANRNSAGFGFLARFSRLLPLGFVNQRKKVTILYIWNTEHSRKTKGYAGYWHSLSLEVHRITTVKPHYAFSDQLA